MVAAAALCAATESLACAAGLPGRARTAESARYIVAWQTSPAPPVVGEHFVVDFAVCPKAGAKRPPTVRVDAQMPDHRHGMNYRPTITASGNGRFRAEGMLLHMRGRWVVDFELGEGLDVDRVRAELVL